jgi:thioredoxin reductase
MLGNFSNSLPVLSWVRSKNEKTGIFGNGDYGFELSRLVNNWTKELTLYTNGKSILTEEQAEKLRRHNIRLLKTKFIPLNTKMGKFKTSYSMTILKRP